MAVSAARPTVSTAATLLTVGAEGDFMPGRTVVVTNPGPTEVFLGGAEVTAADGYPVGEGITVSADLHGEALYGIVGSGTQVVHVLQAGV